MSPVQSFFFFLIQNNLRHAIGRIEHNGVRTKYWNRNFKYRFTGETKCSHKPYLKFHSIYYFYSLYSILCISIFLVRSSSLHSSHLISVVRPAGLKDTPGTGEYLAIPATGGNVGPQVSREDVAKFIVTLVRDTRFDNGAVSVGAPL